MHSIINTADILHNLPWWISIWTGMILSWGLYINMLLKHIQSKQHNPTKMYEIPFLNTMNIILFTYAILGPFLERYINDTFIVINICYSTILSLVTYNVAAVRKKIASLKSITFH